MNRNAVIVCHAYRDFVRKKGCLICRNPMAEFDHLKARGFGEGKRNDLTGIALCHEHHRERGYGLEKFEAKYKVNLWAEAAWNLIEFFADEERRAEAVITVSDKVVNLWG